MHPLTDGIEQSALRRWVRQPWMLRVGARDVLIRGANPRDLAAVALMHKRCTARSLLGRYHQGGRAPSPFALEDSLRQPLSFIACTGRGEVVALAVAGEDRHADTCSDATGGAEIGLLVVDGWQRQGLGREMLTHLAGGAHVHGYTQLITYTATDEPATRRLLTRVGRTFAVREGKRAHLHTYLTESASLGLGAVREHLAS